MRRFYSRVGNPLRARNFPALPAVCLIQAIRLYRSRVFKRTRAWIARKRREWMKDQIDRRSFLRIAGMSVGIGLVYEFAPLLTRRAAAGAINDAMKSANREAPGSFTFAHFTDP